MISRAIDFDPFGVTLAVRLFGHARRFCVVLAISAVALGALDIANIRSRADAAAAIRDGSMRVVAGIPADLQFIAFTSAEPQAVAAIPRETLATKALTAKNSAVAGLAATGNQDAIQFAMAVRPPAPTADRAAHSRLPTEPFQLASADANAIPAPSGPRLAEPMTSPLDSTLALAMVPLPRPAPGVPPPSPAERLHLEGKEYVRAQRCLANAIYFEARSEPVRGQMAVAQVVVNRAFSGFYPNDICGVVYQNASRHLACQFTFACDGKSKVITERGHWARANRIAKETLDGQIYVPEVAKSTHYHAIYVHPNWVGEMKKMVRYGLHNFYRPYAWGNGAEEPVWGSAAMAQAEAKKKN